MLLKHFISTDYPINVSYPTKFIFFQDHSILDLKFSVQAWTQGVTSRYERSVTILWGWHHGSLGKTELVGLRGKIIHIVGWRHLKINVLVEIQSSQSQDVATGVPQNCVPRKPSSILLTFIIRLKAGRFTTDCLLTLHDTDQEQDRIFCTEWV